MFVGAKGVFNPYSEMGLYSIRETGKVCPSDYYGVADRSELDYSKLGSGN